jgi:dihydroorotate dehydrogenase electron transfer subunit
MPVSLDPPLPAPAQLADGTINAVVVQAAHTLGAATLLTVALPNAVANSASSGRYLLARCGAQTEQERAELWSFPLRRPLFVAGVSYSPPTEQEADSTWLDLLLPPPLDASYRWLAALAPGDSLNLLGPLGNGFEIAPHIRNLLMVTDSAHLPLLLGLIDQLLDRGSRVTLLLRGVDAIDEAIRNRLPIPVELRLANDAQQWQMQLRETVQWADQVVAALPQASYAEFAAQLRQHRLRLPQDFGLILTESNLVCGMGACFACTIPLPDGGQTRACVHGPVFALPRLYA